MESEEVLTPSIVLLELSYKSEKEGWDFNSFFNFIKTHSKIAGMNEQFILSFGQAYNKVKSKIKITSSLTATYTLLTFNSFFWLGERRLMVIIGKFPVLNPLKPGPER